MPGMKPGSDRAQLSRSLRRGEVRVAKRSSLDSKSTAWLQSLCLSPCINRLSELPLQAHQMPRPVPSPTTQSARAREAWGAPEHPPIFQPNPGTPTPHHPFCFNLASYTEPGPLNLTPNRCLNKSESDLLEPEAILPPAQPLPLASCHLVFSQWLTNEPMSGLKNWCS